PAGRLYPPGRRPVPALALAPAPSQAWLIGPEGRGPAAGPLQTSSRSCQGPPFFGPEPVPPGTSPQLTFSVARRMVVRANVQRTGVGHHRSDWFRGPSLAWGSERPARTFW